MAQGLAVFMLAAGGVFMDLRSDKVSNPWIVQGYLLGILWQIWLFGARGLADFLTGALLPLALLFPLFYLRMLGAGDLKLLSVIGGFLGPLQVLCCMKYVFFCGAVLALALLIARRNLGGRLHYFSLYLWKFIQTGEVLPYGKKGKRPENFHFTVPVLLGVLCWLGGFR